MSFVNTRLFSLEDCREHIVWQAKEKREKQDIWKSEEEKTIKLELEEVSKHITRAR